MRLLMGFIALIASAFIAAAPSVVRADDCEFPSAAVESYAEHVTAATFGITCNEARWVYNNSPYWKARLPYQWVHVVTSTTRTCLSCLAATASTFRCRVEGYVAATNPWSIPETIAHVDWVKRWDYDGWEVFNVAYKTEPWSFLEIGLLDGYPVNEAWWTQIGSSPHAQHTNRKWANFSSRIAINIPWIGPAGYVAKTQVYGKYNGDWGSINHEGSAGCQR